MKPSRPIDTTISDYAAVVSLESAQGIPVVVGGQAANVWALFYYSRIGRQLARLRPFTSKDLDLAGD